MFFRRPPFSRPFPANRIRGLVIASLAWLSLGPFGAASATEETVSAPANIELHLKLSNGIFSADLQATARTLNYARSLLGSPYKRGGNDPKTGTDCSGFVRHVYQRSEGITLPHNAAQMSGQGELVEHDALRPGDLVFFNTLHKPFSHVGIYLGDGEFVHAASSRNRRVMVSHMAQSYWRDRYDGARRLASASPIGLR